MNKNLLQKCQCICKYTSIDFLMKIHELQLSCIEQITGFGYPFGIWGREDREIGKKRKENCVLSFMLSFDVIIFHGQQMLSLLCYFPLNIFCGIFMFSFDVNINDNTLKIIPQK
jgi:hypothetical protein